MDDLVIETIDDIRVRLGLPEELSPEQYSKKYCKTYADNLPKVARMIHLVDKLASNSEIKGLKLNAKKLKYSTNTLKQYATSTMSMLRHHSEKEEYRRLGEKFMVRASGDEVLVQDRTTIDRKQRKLDPISVEPIKAEMTEVSRTYSTKDQVAEWLEDVMGEDSLTLSDVTGLTNNDRLYLNGLKDEGIIKIWIYHSETQTLGIKR